MEIVLGRYPRIILVVTAQEAMGEGKERRVILLTARTHMLLAFLQPGCVTPGIECLKGGISTCPGQKHPTLPHGCQLRTGNCGTKTPE